MNQHLDECREEAGHREISDFNLDKTEFLQTLKQALIQQDSRACAAYYCQNRRRLPNAIDILEIDFLGTKALAETGMSDPLPFIQQALKIYRTCIASIIFSNVDCLRTYKSYLLWFAGELKPDTDLYRQAKILLMVYDWIIAQNSASSEPFTNKSGTETMLRLYLDLLKAFYAKKEFSYISVLYFDFLRKSKMKSAKKRKYECYCLQFEIYDYIIRSASEIQTWTDAHVDPILRCYHKAAEYLDWTPVQSTIQTYLQHIYTTLSSDCMRKNVEEIHDLYFHTQPLKSAG